MRHQGSPKSNPPEGTFAPVRFDGVVEIVSDVEDGDAESRVGAPGHVGDARRAGEGHGDAIQLHVVQQETVAPRDRGRLNRSLCKWNEGFKLWSRGLAKSLEEALLCLKKRLHDVLVTQTDGGPLNLPESNSFCTIFHQIDTAWRIQNLVRQATLPKSNREKEKVMHVVRNLGVKILCLKAGLKGSFGSLRAAECCYRCCRC